MLAGVVFVSVTFTPVSAYDWLVAASVYAVPAVALVNVALTPVSTNDAADAASA